MTPLFALPPERRLTKLEPIHCSFDLAYNKRKTRVNPLFYAQCMKDISWIFFVAIFDTHVCSYWKFSTFEKLLGTTHHGEWPLEAHALTPKLSQLFSDVTWKSTNWQLVQGRCSVPCSIQQKWRQRCVPLFTSLVEKYLNTKLGIVSAFSSETICKVIVAGKM